MNVNISVCTKRGVLMEKATYNKVARSFEPGKFLALFFSSPPEENKNILKWFRL